MSVDDPHNVKCLLTNHTVTASFPHHTQCLLTNHTVTRSFPHHTNVGTHDDRKFSTLHRMSSHWILKTHWYYHYNFFYQKMIIPKNTSLGVPPLPPIPLYTLRNVPLYLYIFQLFFPYFYTYIIDLLLKPSVGCQGTNQCYYFFFLFMSSIFCSSPFLKKNIYFNNIKDIYIYIYKYIII